MNIRPKQRYSFKLPNGDTEIIEVISSASGNVQYQHIMYSSKRSEVHIDTFTQLVNNGYFKQEGEAV